MRLSRVVAAIAAVVAVSFGFAVPAQAATVAFKVTVVNSSGQALSTGCLVAVNGAGTSKKDCTAASGGVYYLSGLPATQYTVSLVSFEGYADRVVGKRSTSLTAKVHLERLVAYSGTLVDDLGNPIGNAKVSFSVNTGTASIPKPVTSVVTDSNGKFTAKAARQTYLVYLDGVSGFGRAEFATTSAGSGSTVNFGTVTIMRAGHLSGVRALPPGRSRSTVCVVIWDLRFYQPAGSDCGPPGAAFTISDLRPGTYRVCVGGTDKAGGCWVDANNDADWVNRPAVVTAGNTSGDTVAWGGTSKATVTTSSGKPVVTGCVTATVQVISLSVTDCNPASGVFNLAIPADVSSAGVTYSLAGSANAFDKTWDRSVTVAGGSAQSVALTARERGNGSLTVNVSRDDAANIGSGCVDLYSTPAMELLESKCNLASGTVAFADLPGGDYAVTASNVAGSYSQWWYPGAVRPSAGAGTLTLADSQSRVVTLVLPTTQVLTGVVRDPDGVAQAGGTVTFAADSTEYGSTTTAGDGSFSLQVPIVVGGLRLSGFEGAFDSWADYQADYSSAPRYGGPASSPSAVTGLTLRTAPASYLVGTIAGPPSLGSGELCVYPAPLYGEGKSSTGACGQPGQQFSIPVMPFGTYSLCVHAGPTSTPCGGDPSTWEDFGSGERARIAVTHAGETPVALAFGGSLHIVVNSTGTPKPLEGGCAQLSTARNGVVATSCNSAGGAFDFVFAEDIDNEDDGTFAVTGMHGADDVSGAWWAVGGGASRTLTVYANRWRQFVGTITRPAGFEDTQACVLATNLVDVFESTCLEPGQTNYRLPVPRGSYYLQFYTEEPGVAAEWYPKAAVIAKAKTVEVSYYDVSAPFQLEQGGTIAGAVTDPDGNVAVDGCVSAVGDDGWTVDFECPGADGMYSFESLPVGGYRLKFDGFAGAAQSWYREGIDFGSATRVNVGAGATVTANQQLSEAAHLSGVVSKGGAPATGGCVVLVSPDGYDVERTCDIVGGAYSFDDVPQGRFAVRFEGFSDAATMWGAGAVVFDRATWYSFAPGQSRSVNIDLPTGSTISGKSGAVGEVEVELRTLDGHVVATTPLTEVDPLSPGTYKFSGVAPGTYNVRFVVSATGVGVFARESGLLTPRALTIPTAGGVSITGVSPPANPVVFKEFRGSLNLPGSWKSSTLCVLAYTPGYSNPVKGSYCGKRGEHFELSWTGGDALILFTNGRVRSNSEYKVFTGTKRWYGNTADSHATPYFSLDNAMPYYLPVWFYNDVTAKTTNFQAIQWLGDYNIYRPSANTFRPDSTMTRRDLATYLYKVAGSPAVALPSKSPFADVPTTDAAYKPLLWMRATKVWTSTTFKPTAALDKRTEALILYRAAGSPSVALPSKNPYTDIKSSDAAYKAVVWANKYKIVAKTSNSTYGVTSTVKRKYAAASLYAWWWY